MVGQTIQKDAVKKSSQKEEARNSPCLGLLFPRPSFLSLFSFLACFFVPFFDSLFLCLEEASRNPTGSWKTAHATLPRFFLPSPLLVLFDRL